MQPCSIPSLLACLAVVGLLYVVQSVQSGSHHAAWNHMNQASWARDYPLCASKSMRPSPIDIRTNQLKYRPGLDIELNNYDQEIAVSLQNTRHSVNIKPRPDVAPLPSVKLSWLPEGEQEFELQDIHFHWDSDGLHKGSEHAINGELAVAEMHLVHYKRNVSKEDIGKIENSIVVLGVLIESNNIEHNKIEVLVRDLAKVNGTEEECDGDEPELMIDLLPDHHDSFYTYNGSLTTPPCYEVVTWVVMSSPLYMSYDQLNQLANFQFREPNGAHKKIGPNHRYLQPLHDRPVFSSFNVTDAAAAAADAKKDTISDLIVDDYWNKLISLPYSAVVNGLESMKQISGARTK